MRLAIHAFLFLSLSIVLSGQDPPTSAGRVYVHRRGSGPSALDSWVEDGVSRIHVPSDSKLYTISSPVATFRQLSPPSVLGEWKGKLKFRRDSWWFLASDPSPMAEKHPSELYRYNEAETRWVKHCDFTFRAANFEFCNNGEIVAFGVHDLKSGKRYVGSTISSDNSVSYLDEIPFHDFEDWFWDECLTARNDSQIYAYFPSPGRIFSVSQSSRALISYKTPWPEMTHESIAETISAAKGKDCYISTIDHPGAEHCYFLSYLEPQMLLVYKKLDQEQEDRSEMATGSRPVVEHVLATLLSPDSSKAVQEWPTPSPLQLDKWFVDTHTGFLIPITKIKTAEKMPNSGSRKPCLFSSSGSRGNLLLPYYSRVLPDAAPL